ncbi:MAG TPA: hypothetical protein VGA69_09310 [Nitriliruptorales bacterium]
MTWDSLADLDADLVECRRCPRLVEWREHVAREKRAAFADQEYWGRPVPGFGDTYAAGHVVRALAVGRRAVPGVGRSAATGESYERLVRCHIVPRLGRVKLVDIDARTIHRAWPPHATSTST